MALQITTNINVDFYDKKYILINAKQYDSSSRWISVTCYNQGDLYNLSANKHTAYIRYRKADEKGVLNSCRIDYRGNVLVELTEQMLASEGICYVDLIIVDKGSAVVNVDTGEIITIDGSAIMSTMAFCVNVYEAAFDSSVIESSDEYIALNDALQMANAEYKEVIQLARSYAIGDADDIRENEDFDNSEYYSRLSKSYAIGDLDGATETKNRENEGVDNAEYYSRLAKSYAIGDLDGNTETKDRENESTDNAQYYSQMSKSFAMGGTGINERIGEDTDNAEYYSQLSKSYAKGGTDIIERNSNGENENEDNAEYYSRLAKSYAMGSFDGNTGTRDDELAENAKTYMETSLSHAITSQRYAVGGTGTVTGEDTDNAKYYCEQADESESASRGYAELSEENMNTAIASASAAAGSEINAAGSATSASTSATNAAGSAELASNSAEAANNSANVALEAASNIAGSVDVASNAATLASGSAEAANNSANEAANSAENASESANEAATNAEMASTSATNAFNSAKAASNSEANAHIYYLQVEEITTGLSGAFLPMGTIEFAELATLLETGEVKAGYLYNISNNFITDDSFKRGVGVEYAAGTNVYFTSEGYWDCLSSTTVTGIKGDKETEYRQGDVNITVENIGAIPSSDMATVDEVKSYLGI